MRSNLISPPPIMRSTWGSLAVGLAVLGVAHAFLQMQPNRQAVTHQRVTARGYTTSSAPLYAQTDINWAQWDPAEACRYVPEVTRHVVRDRKIFVKNDQDFRLEIAPNATGNAARKLVYLSRLRAVDFPESILTYGDVHSDMLPALTHLCEAKGSRLTWYTKPVPEVHQSNPTGNFGSAIESDAVAFVEFPVQTFKLSFGNRLGRRMVKQQMPNETTLLSSYSTNIAAQQGMRVLADEIAEWWTQQPENVDGSLGLVVPSVTGTTALLLAHYLLPWGIKVLAVGVGVDVPTLKANMNKIAINGTMVRPSVLASSTRVPVYQPRAKLLEVHRELAKAGIPSDLYVSARAWEIALANWNTRFFRRNHVMFYNPGGIQDLPAQLVDYEQAGLIERGNKKQESVAQ